MAHCININSPEYKALVSQTKLGQRELKARIATWQEINKTDKFPSIEQVEGLLDVQASPVTIVADNSKFIKDNLSDYDSTILQESFDNILNNEKVGELGRLKVDINELYNGSPLQSQYVNAFINAFGTLTSNSEKNEIFKSLTLNGRNMFEVLSEMYDDYLSYPEGFSDYHNITTRVFERLHQTGQALNSHGSLIFNQLKEANNTIDNKYKNDDRTYNQIDRRLVISHKGKSASQVQGAINHAINVLKRNFSDKVEVRVSQPKATKNGLTTFVYVEKPNRLNYASEASMVSPERLQILESNKEKYFGDTNETTARQLLTNIKKHSKGNNTLVDLILKKLPEDLKVLYVDTTVLSKGDYNFEVDIETASAIYNGATNTIILSKTGMTPTVIMHEILHGMSVNYMRENQDSKLVKDFNSIFNHVKQELGDEKWYATSNLNEFIVALFTDTNFMNRIKEINPSKEVGNYKNVFQELFNKILEFFGIKNNSTAYEQAFSIASNIINDNYNYISTMNDFYQGDAYTKEELGKLNSTFMVSPSPVEVINTPYTQALKRLNSKYALQDIKDSASLIANQFSKAISWYHEPFLSTKSREEIINELTPQRVFKEIKEELEITLQEYIEDKQEQRYIDNLQKLIDNYNDLAMMATNEINFMEGLKFNSDDLKTYDYNMKEELDSGVSQTTEMDNEVEFHEESVVDGWMKNFKYSSVADSLTNKVKRALSDVNELDSKGNPVLNSMGYPRKISMDIIKNAILKDLQNVITSKDVLPALGIMAKSRPWATSIVRALEADNELMSQFYSVFKKDFVSHSIVTTSESPDGVVSYKTPIINQSDDLNLWIEDWRNSLENKVIYNSNYSVYNTDGTLNLKNIENNIKIIKELTKEWESIKKYNDRELRKDFIGRKNITIKNQLNAIGIGLDSLEVKDLLQDALVDSQELKTLFGVDKSNFNLDTILSKLNNQNNWAKNNFSKEGINALSLIQDNNSNYSSIARLVANSLEELIEGSVHENGKSYYTYLQPSYLSKITKQLKNVKGNNKEFEEFIQKEFKQYEGTIYNLKDNDYNIPWLNLITDKKEGHYYRDLFNHKVVLNFNKTDYSALSPADYQSLLLVEYFSPSVNATNSDKSKAWYHVPILAEAPSAEFIQFKRYITNYKDNIAEELLKTFTYEYNRIKMVRARKEGIANGSIKSIKNFDDAGDKFHFLTFLNEHLSTIDGIVNKQGELASVMPSELFNFLKETIKENLDMKANKAIDSLNELGLLDKTENGKFKHLSTLGINPNNVNDKLQEYFYNSYLATANIIQLTSTDLSYYKNVEDFQKRNKEIHAPGTMVNTQATYNGERIGKDRETYIILKDQEQTSSSEVLAHIKAVFDNNKLLSPIEKESILSKYYENNITDAQAYRSLDSAKTVIAMSTGWNDKLEASYQRLKKGQWDMKDYDTIMQAFKPFVYTQTTVDSGVLIDANDPSKGNRMIKVPTQHKNSEAILLPMLGMQFNSPKLRGLMQAMSENNIDVIMFESAVKVGLQGVLDINDMSDRQQISDYISSFREDNQVFKTISYEDYKIQQPIPEHLQDTSQLFGTQLRKLVIADIASDAVFDIRGTSLDKQGLLNLYNNLIIENTIESYEGLIEEFGTPEKLQAVIENELVSNSRYSKDLLNAAQLGSDGKFVLPLFDPSQSNRIQQLLNSIWKSRVTKQKIKGGKAVQVSSFGLSDSLELKFKEVDGKIAIEYMEAYLPFWSENVPANWETSGDFVDPKTGIMDVAKMLKAGIIDEEFLEGISYRIPTEDAYSIWPIKVKGFLPRNSGGNIILPREITTITGSDFDIDSMYLMLKEFNFNDKTGKFETIKPDMTKDASELNGKQRNNLLIDIVRGILSHPNTASKQLNPGNFDGPKLTARRLNLLASGANYSWSQLEKMSLKELDAISNKNQLDILDYTTQISLHKQNMTAAKLIGIIANHSTNHAVRQNTKIAVNPQARWVTNKEKGEKELKYFDRFKLNGKFLTSLHSIVNPTKTANISKNYASFLAASVDAVKDPVLSFFNLNTFTADSAMLLTGLGYSFDEVGLLLRQPAIEELVTYYDRNSMRGLTKTQAVEDMLYEYKKFLNETLNTPISNFDMYSNNFTSDKMASMISLGANLKEMKKYEGAEKESFIRNNYGDVQDFYKYQYQVLLNYKEILDTSQHLADFVGAAKADTGNGGAGPTIADTKFKLRRIDKHRDNSNPRVGTPVLGNADVIQLAPKEIINDTAKIREFLRNSPLGFIQGFTTLGLQATSDTLSKHFPHYHSYFDYMFNKMEDEMLKSSKLSVELMNQIYGEFFTYYMSQFSDFNREGADTFIREFPKKFLDMKNHNEELKNLQIIKNIQYINPGAEVPMAKLKFRSGGKLSSTIRDTMIMEWESLLYQPKYRQLAIDLFKYNYYVNGFGFGATSFIHLAPTAVKLEMPNFTDNLYKLMDMTGETDNNRFSQQQLDTFIDQYYRNHLGNRRLVPEISSIAPESLLDSNKQIVETLEIKSSKQDYGDMFTSKGGVLPYIAINMNGVYEYFRTTQKSLESDERVFIELQHIQPLGIKNNFLEYDFGNSSLSTTLKEESSGNVNSRDEYQQHYNDATQSQDAYDHEYVPEPTYQQEMPVEMMEHFSNAFDYIEQENNKFKTQREQAFEALTEDDMPAFVGNYSQIENDISEAPDFSEAFQALVEEVSKPLYYEGDIVPSDDTIFVFGSNPEGRHGAGAAKIAKDKFGAIYGKGEGLYGNSYAIPTKDLRIKNNNSLKSIDESTIINSIKKMYTTAINNSNKKFKVAYRNVNTVSLNGYTGLEMIDMFKKAGPIPSNVIFSKEWVDTNLLSNSIIEEFKNKCN